MISLATSPDHTTKDTLEGRYEAPKSSSKQDKPSQVNESSLWPASSFGEMFISPAETTELFWPTAMENELALPTNTETLPESGDPNDTTGLLEEHKISNIQQGSFWEDLARLRYEGAQHDSVVDHEPWTILEQFFQTGHLIFPILYYHDLHARLTLEPDWQAVPSLRTLVLAMQLMLAAGQYRMKIGPASAVSELARRVEMSRLDYDFAETPSLDEVAISLFLFTAYNVLEKHGRAFLYLDECLSLMEAVGPVSEWDEPRRIRMEHVLYNTEAASLAIYAGNKRKRKARVPSLKLDDAGIAAFAGLEHDQDVDQMAIKLLRRLTEIHLSEHRGPLQSVESASQADADLLYEAACQRNPFYRIQAADVAISRQWQLSRRLLDDQRSTRSSSLRRLDKAAIQTLGTAAMAGICLLQEGEVRIVGLGKLAGLVQNMFALSGTRQCDYSVAGIVGAIVREDHERNFAFAVEDVLGTMLATIPASLGNPTKPYTTEKQIRTIMIDDGCIHKPAVPSGYSFCRANRNEDIESCGDVVDMGLPMSMS